jgi:hypothetical protein
MVYISCPICFQHLLTFLNLLPTTSTSLNNFLSIILLFCDCLSRLCSILTCLVFSFFLHYNMIFVVNIIAIVTLMFKILFFLIILLLE